MSSHLHIAYFDQLAFRSLLLFRKRSSVFVSFRPSFWRGWVFDRIVTTLNPYLTHIKPVSNPSRWRAKCLCLRRTIRRNTRPRVSPRKGRTLPTNWKSSNGLIAQEPAVPVPSVRNLLSHVFSSTAMCWQMPWRVVNFFFLTDCFDLYSFGGPSTSRPTTRRPDPRLRV